MCYEEGGYVRRITLGLLVLCFVVWMAPVSAQDSTALSAIPPEGFQITGTWDCEGTFRNNQVHKSIFTGAVILGGKWLELTEQDTQPTTGYLAKYLIGYDSQQKHLVEIRRKQLWSCHLFQRRGLAEPRVDDDLSGVAGCESGLCRQPLCVFHYWQRHIHCRLTDQQDGSAELDTCRSPCLQT
jgi:hypothetical protein